MISLNRRSFSVRKKDGVDKYHTQQCHCTESCQRSRVGPHNCFALTVHDYGFSAEFCIDYHVLLLAWEGLVEKFSYLQSTHEQSYKTNHLIFMSHQLDFTAILHYEMGQMRHFSPSKVQNFTPRIQETILLGALARKLSDPMHNASSNLVTVVPMGGEGCVTAIGRMLTQCASSCG